MTGCAADWDTLTGHRFRDGLLDHPIETTKRLWVPEDPMLVLRTEPPRDGDERAAAMHRIKEPILNGGTQEDQDIIINILTKSAATDASPVVRMEAVGALGRFEDPRAVGALMTAYQSAHGRVGFDPPPLPRIETAPIGGTSAGRMPTMLSGRSRDFDAIQPPTGFQPEWVSAIRCRIIEALGRTGRPEAADFLAVLAGGTGADTAIDGSDDRDIKLAAVRGLGLCRQPKSVIALNQVLNQAASVAPASQDTAIISRSHEGLVRLTGQKLPPDPQQWNTVVQAGVVIAPEPGWWDNTVVQISAWAREFK